MADADNFPDITSHQRQTCWIFYPMDQYRRRFFEDFVWHVSMHSCVNMLFVEQVLKHTAKVYLSCKTLTLDTTERTPDDRPYATYWVSGVGVENVAFEPRVALSGITLKYRT